MDTTLIWFTCANPECNYVPNDVYRRNKKAGVPLNTGARGRLFMVRLEGTYSYPNEDIIIFRSIKFGDIIVYDRYNESKINSFLYPIKDKLICGVCQKKLINIKALFPNGVMTANE